MDLNPRVRSSRPAHRTDPQHPAEQNQARTGAATLSITQPLEGSHHTEHARRMMAAAPGPSAGIRDGSTRKRPIPRALPLPGAHLSLAEDYERRTEMFPGWRDRLVGMLAPRRGDTVIDVGCGSGLNFPALQAWVGPGGRIIGVDDSPRLLAVAARHVTGRGWRNVTLINSPAEQAELPDIDAALFCAAHEVLQSPAALSHIFNHVRPGASVVAGGWKWPARWLWPLRVLVTALQGPYIADFTGFDRPWRLLADQVTHLQVTEVGFGAGYLARGCARASHTAPTSGPPHRPSAGRSTSRFVSQRTHAAHGRAPAAG
ncbi:class I SAM-dependent methyltransferase [Pseudonocardia sp. Cha107L01]|jgi:demethylmenaquinone methyltransferase/2-methoxy-6-polyprenyl-1,4-benzoquinol methylase|uniref:class I SAM-dependent methyltransferase n=1 Tax=Pseudonocardia sp. Cha107L01 TaxID=3457576 RepID=UPI00403EA8A1